MFAAAVTLLIASLASSVLADVFITDPVAATTFTGGTSVSITWQDNGNAPSLAAFGAAEVGIYVGNALQQTEVQQIVANVNVSTTQTIQFTVNPNAGPNGDFYFIRFQSLELKDATNPQFPAEAFSARFTLIGMSGTFNSTEQSQVNGASTAPIGGSSSSSSTSGSSSSSSSVPAKTTPSNTPIQTTGGTTPSTTPTGSSATDTNGAKKFLATGFAGFAAVLVAVCALAL